MRALLAMLFTVAIGIGPASGQENSWVGKTIITKKSGIKIGKTGVDGKQVYVGELTNLSCEVLGDKDGWLKVQDGRGNAGWFDKADAILVDDAVEFFTERVRQNGNDARAFYCRAIAWAQKGELDIAIKDCGEVLRLDPKNLSAFDFRGRLWYRKKEYDKAVAEYDEVIRLDPKNVSAFYQRGSAWYGKKEHDKAITDFSEVIRLDPKNEHAYAYRGNAWEGKKEYDKAIADYDEAIRLNPKTVLTYSYRASAWRGKKAYDKAIANYEEAIRIDPKDPHAYKNRARLWATCPDANYRDGVKAVESARKALDLDPKNAGFYADTLAAAYAENGEFAEAVGWQEKALADPLYKNSNDARRRLELYRDKKPYRQE